MKPIDVKSSKLILSKTTMQKDLKFKIGDIVRISTYKNIFAKGYTANWSAEVLKMWLKTLKVLCCGYMLLLILYDEERFVTLIQ